MAGRPQARRILGLGLGWVSPHLVDDLCRVRALGDWFLPLIVWKKFRTGTLFSEARDRLWDFVVGLRLWHYGKLGLKGFVGSVLWLALPTWLLIEATQNAGPVPVLLGVGGSLIAIPVFSLLPFLQVHFATDGRLSRFLEVRQVLSVMGRAPFSHLLALLFTLLLRASPCSC